MPRLEPFAATCVAFVLVACSSSSSSPSTATSPDAGSDATTPITGEGDVGTKVGSFVVNVTPGNPGSTTLVGKVYDGPTPSTILWETALSDAACALATPRVPYCNTPCGGSAACVDDDHCADYPTARPVGDVTASGLHTSVGESSFTMTAIASTYQVPAQTTLAYPPFAEGEAVRLVAAGSYFAGFTLESEGIAPLVLTSTSLVLKSGEPLPLTWTPGAAGVAKIHVELDISHHGGTKGQIECETDDTGALTISAEMITELLSLGVAGYPSVIVKRRAVGSAAVAAGRVDLEIASTVEQQVSVEGLTSCTSASDCPADQTCQPNLTCK